MGKYTPLGDFLRAQRARDVPMTFAEIERVTGVKLPPTARHHRAWWSNNPTNNVMTKVWLDAGYETAEVDMKARTLVFRRVAQSRAEGATGAPARTSGQPPLFGAMKGLVIIPSGVDLTEPADPEWADLLDQKYGPAVR